MKKKKPRRLSAYEKLGVLFVLILFGFGALNLWHRDRNFSEEENRMLSQKPRLELAAVVDGKYMSSFETYQTDQFVFRNGWIRLRTAADLLLGKNQSGGVFLGKQNQLFEQPAKLREQTFENLDAVLNFCGRHPELSGYLMLVPDAAGVNPEGLPAFAPVESQKDQLERISAYLDGGIREIPVYETLREHKDEYIYYRSDHHWTTLGSWYAYKKAGEIMGLSVPEEEPVLYPVTASFEGTLVSTSGYQVPADTISVYWPENQPQLVVTYPQEQQKSASLYGSEKLKTKDKYGMFLNGNHPLVEIRTMAEGGRRLLLIKDSYANCFVPWLTAQFEEIVLVDPRYYYDNLEELMKQHSFTDVLFLYNLNTFLQDDVLHYVLEEPKALEATGA